MLWAVTGKTVAEIIESRSNPEKSNMGLNSWKGSVVRKRDVGVSKNYLKKDEVTELNRIVTMYLDYAELQAKGRKTISMKQWEKKLDTFLNFNEQEVLAHSGKVTALVAKNLAEERYEMFDLKRRERETLEADENDIKEIEELSRRLKIKGNEYEKK